MGLGLVLTHELLLLLTLSLISVVLHAFVHIEVHMHVLVDITLVVVRHISTLVHLVGLILRPTLHPSVKVLLHFHVSLLLDGVAILLLICTLRAGHWHVFLSKSVLHIALHLWIWHELLALSLDTSLLVSLDKLLTMHHLVIVGLWLI